jgi:hypothetical protein
MSEFTKVWEQELAGNTPADVIEDLLPDSVGKSDYREGKQDYIIQALCAMEALVRNQAAGKGRSMKAEDLVPTLLSYVGEDPRAGLPTGFHPEHWGLAHLAHVMNNCDLYDEGGETRIGDNYYNILTGPFVVEGEDISLTDEAIGGWFGYASESDIYYTFEFAWLREKTLGSPAYVKHHFDEHNYPQNGYTHEAQCGIIEMLGKAGGSLPAPALLEMINPEGSEDLGVWEMEHLAHAINHADGTWWQLQEEEGSPFIVEGEEISLSPYGQQEWELMVEQLFKQHHGENK